MVLAVTLGSLTYGYNAAILGNTFSKPAFYTYEKLDPTGPGEAHTGTLIALWNALTYVGGFFGCLILFPVLSSRFGRKMPLAVASVLVILGTGLTSGEINPAMLAAGRVIQGLGAGIFLPGCAIYPAEVAPAHSRGLLVGLHVAVIGLGFAVAEWIGAAFFYVHGQVDWRVPLAIEAGPSSLLLCIIYFLPESPRWRKSSRQKPVCLPQMRNRQVNSIHEGKSGRSRKDDGFTSHGQERSNKLVPS